MPACIACKGRGWRWGRGRTGQAYMVKKKCAACKGTGKLKEIKK